MSLIHRKLFLFVGIKYQGAVNSAPFLCVSYRYIYRHVYNRGIETNNERDKMNKKAIKELKAKLAKGKNLVLASIAISKKYHCDFTDVHFYAVCLTKEA